ncbi:MAG: type II toxin-antitoxin system RelE/ParE family toxin [Spirochaetes bacterium]|nr:type II toxin-antitoxin system RelE/ParE family toxin [Spirochaetota bacterium]
MSWTLRFASGIDRDLKRLDRADARFIVDNLICLAGNYSTIEADFLKTGRIKRLGGRWEGFLRLRLRTYRVIYKKYEETLMILVVRIAHRREAQRS